MNAREKIAAVLELVPTFSEVTLITISDVDEGVMVAPRGCTIELTRAELAQLAAPADVVTPSAPVEPEEWGSFIDHGDGNGFYEDKGPRLPTKADAETRARFTEIAMLRARVSTLVKAEARAVAGEKAAREALAQAKPIQGLGALRALLANLEKNRLDRHADTLRVVIGMNEPKAEA